MKFRLKKKQRQLCHLVSGGFAVFLGMVLLYFHTAIFDLVLDEYLVFEPNTTFTNNFLNPGVVCNVKLYFFNWTNPEDLLNKTVKPKFEEMGPYLYRQLYTKTDVVFNENDTITFRSNKTYIFIQEESNGTEYDNITTLNMVPAIASDKARNWNFFLRKGLSIALNSVSHYTTNEQWKYVFEGYDDLFLTSSRYLPFIDDLPDLAKFAWFFKKNASTAYDGVYNVGTGLGNTTIGTMYNWNYKETGPYPGKCGNIEAPIGEIFPQHAPKEKMDLFSTEFCKVVTFDFAESGSWNGVDSYKFVADLIIAGTYNLDKKCLCSRKCPKYGVVDYSSCKFDLPIYLSLPHFSKADPSFRNKVEGMKPGHEDHEMFIRINPRTGISLEFNIAVQLNFLLQPNPDISLFQDVPELMFPLVWFSVRGRLPVDLTFQLKIALWLPTILKIISIFSIIAGTVLIARTLYESQDKKKSRIVLKPVDEEQYFLGKMDVDSRFLE